VDKNLEVHVSPTNDAEATLASISTADNKQIKVYVSTMKFSKIQLVM